MALFQRGEQPKGHSAKPTSNRFGNGETLRHGPTRKRKKVAGADSSDLRPIWLPTVDNLRNFFLTPTTEMLRFLREVITYYCGKPNVEKTSHGSIGGEGICDQGYLRLSPVSGRVNFQC